MLGDGTASPVPEGAGKEHAKGASCGRDSPCSPADTQSSSTPSTREQQPRCVAAQPGVGFALRVLGGMVGAVPSGTQEERAARRRAEAAAAEAAAAAAREARAAASREAARGARVIAVSRSSGRGGGARASRHTANTPRVVSWQGDWQCACGSVHSMYRECRTCGGSKPCWDYLRGTCDFVDCRFPHLPLDLPAGHKPPPSERVVRLYSRSVLYEKAQRPTAPDPAEAAPTQQQQQAVLQAPQGVPAIYVNIVQQPAAAAPPGAGAQVEQLAALMQEVLARLPPADAAAVQRQAEGRLHAPPPQPQLEPSAAQAAPAPKPPAVVQPQPVQQIAVAQPEHARVPAAMRHLFPQPAGLASGAPRTAAGAPPHAAMAQPHAVQQQLPAPTVLARQLLPPGRAPQAPAARAEPECVYCLDTAASVALIPCGHVVLCRECAATLLELPHAACPVCRVAATGSLRVFT